VQTEGNAGPNSAQIAALPAFHFVGALFSKTGVAAIHANRLVLALLSTFPAQTAATTKKKSNIFKIFIRSRGVEFRSPYHRALQRPAFTHYDRESTGNNTGEILMQLRGGVE
jgi:hypothetical protein